MGFYGGCNGNSYCEAFKVNYKPKKLIEIK